MLCRRAGRDEGMVISDRTKGCCSSDLNEPPHPNHDQFAELDAHNWELLAAVARLRPDWHLVIVGPIVKIDPASLPQAANIHYLGGKPYGDLPVYIANWDIAVMPFARNAATRFISPTKTPEYLA